MVDSAVEGNGNLTKFRIGKLEASVDELTDVVRDMERKLDTYCANAEAMRSELSKVEARVSMNELRITDVRIEMAKWAAGGGLVGGTLSAVLMQLIEHLLR